MTEFILKQGVVGIKEANEKEATLLIYPNPNTGSVILRVAPFQNQDIRISVHNITGARVYNRTLRVANGSREETIDLSFLARGVYIMQVKAGENTFGYKLVKQ